MTAVKPSQYHSVLLTQIKVYFNQCLGEEATILAHQIRIFEIQSGLEILISLILLM